MFENVVFSVLNAKYIHASPAPYCLRAGVFSYARELFPNCFIVEGTINQDLSKIALEILEKSPKVVGFSCYIWNIEKTLLLCESLKKSCPSLIIALGGPEVSYCATQILEKHSFIDFVLKGEGEESVPKFLRSIFSSEFKAQEIESLCYRDGEKILENPIIVPQNPIPSPFLGGYLESLGGRIAYYETSRNCPFACAFCLSGRHEKLRLFDLDKAFPEMLALANSGTQTIKFVDRTFNANESHCNAILDFILENHGVNYPEYVCFHFEIAGDILKESTFQKLQMLPKGAIQLEIGLQSFNEKTLEAVYRKTNTKQLVANIRRLMSFQNIHVHIDLIAGLPYEDLMSFKESFNLAYELKPHALQLGFLKMLHGSAMRTKTEEFPCEFDQRPPYEVRKTPWLCENDFLVLEEVEHALDKCYNSGRFLKSLGYIFENVQEDAFTFFHGLGIKLREKSAFHHMHLDDFVGFFLDYAKNLKGIDEEMLKDFLAIDRLETISTGHLPASIYREDERLKKAMKALEQEKETKSKKGVQRGGAILQSENTLFYVDYEKEKQDKITKRWSGNKCKLD